MQTLETNGTRAPRSCDPETIRRAYFDKLVCQQGKFPAVATLNDQYLALSYVVRDHLLERWVQSARTYYERGSRTVVYVSAEFLLGPQLGNNLLYLGMTDAARKALEPLGVSLDALLAHEEEPGLGNGGLGRLAACYMDSLASESIPAIGYGLRYEYGIFDQEIRDGQQVEIADKWLRYGNPWEIQRPELLVPVGFGGSTQPYTDAQGRYRVRWVPERTVQGMPYDTAILGYGTNNANFLRLWQAVASHAFDFQAFSSGDYYGAVEDKIRTETISKVLYPNDNADQGKQLRLQQQYLMVCCSLQDMLRIHKQRMPSLHGFHEKFAIQMNDTHPALCVAELMRLLVDEHEFAWEEAWHITVQCLGYTNHTLLPEALEAWKLPLFQRLLPRHTEIVFEINQRFLSEVRVKYPNDEDRVQRMSLIDEHGERAVRMANLACVGSHAVNGVAELHSRLLRSTVLRDFAEMYPERFCNVTNGVTPRRFIALSNPALTQLITEAIGDRWISDLGRLRELEPFAADAAFQQRFREVKRRNKQLLSQHVTAVLGHELDASSLFDVQVKRIHEYKRQLLNLLHAITQYVRIRAGHAPDVRRTVIFAGKAAPGYYMAKLIIRLIHDVAAVIRRDPEVRKWLDVVFVPDFNVKTAEHIYPAVDLSEQISTAGKEASGTGNMKMALNGALTIGTLDGANVEIRERVGADNFFLFGLTAEDVVSLRAAGYRPWERVQRDPELHEVLDLVDNGHFAQGDRSRYAPIVRSLVEWDEYLILEDYRAYVELQSKTAAAFVDADNWSKRAILTVARMGYFSSDRSIREYCDRIWNVRPVKVPPADA
ncbi:MAG TPA: glycogen/starch/alpha-glucan phosphorylase [Polyangiales bacterium]|nr:glycogen/starch/alpha-glucan phosphorylase [Polyangiales bacterium]